MSYFLDNSNLVSKKSKKYLAKNEIQIFKRFAEYVKSVSHISTTFQYDNFIQETISLTINVKFRSIKRFPVYEKEIIQISKSSPLTEKTPWGGVAIKKVDVEKDYIKKLLVITTG